VGVTGTLVATSNGVALIATRASRWFVNGARWITKRVAELRGKSSSVTALAGTAESTSSANAALVQIKPGWDRNAPIDVRVDFVHEEVSEVRRDVEQLRRDSGERHSRLDQKVESLANEIRTDLRELTERVERAERNAARVNAWGFPLIGLGIVMTGVPGGLADVPPVGWLFVVLAGALAAIGIVAVACLSVRRHSPHPFSTSKAS